MTWELLCERVWLLDYAGRKEQAIEELRAHPEIDTWYGAWTLSDLLIDAGKRDEAAAVLEPGFRDGQRTENMAKLMIRQGHVMDAIALLHLYLWHGPQPVTTQREGRCTSPRGLRSWAPVSERPVLCGPGRGNHGTPGAESARRRWRG